MFRMMNDWKPLRFSIVLIMMVFFFIAIIGIAIVLTLYFISENSKKGYEYREQPKQNSQQGASVDVIPVISDKQKDQFLKNYQNAGFKFNDQTLELFYLKEYNSLDQFKKDVEKTINKRS